MWHPSRRLYASEFSGGVIKVGVTGMRGTNRFNCLRHNGEEPLRFYCGALHSGGYWAERELMQRMADIGAVVVRGREWFTEVSFNAACALVDSITAEANERQEQAA